MNRRRCCRNIDNKGISFAEKTMIIWWSFQIPAKFSNYRLGIDIIKNIYVINPALILYNTFSSIIQLSYSYYLPFGRANEVYYMASWYLLESSSWFFLIFFNSSLLVEIDFFVTKEILKFLNSLWFSPAHQSFNSSTELLVKYLNDDIPLLLYYSTDSRF